MGGVVGRRGPRDIEGDIESEGGVKESLARQTNKLRAQMKYYRD